jgi:hypothetical protein
MKEVQVLKNAFLCVPQRSIFSDSEKKNVNPNIMKT